MAVKLSLTGLAKLGDANGLDALNVGLGENDAQYVILRVLPREDTITRGREAVRTTKMLVVGAEPMTDPASIRQAKALMEASCAARIDGRDGAAEPLFTVNGPQDVLRNDADYTDL